MNPTSGADRRLVMVEIALVSLLVVVLIAALMVALLRPAAASGAVATSLPSVVTGTPSATPTPTPQPTHTVFVTAPPSTAVRITSFTISPDPVDCTNLAVAHPVHMQWTSTHGTRATLTVNGLKVDDNLPSSGDDGDLPANQQPFGYSCQPPYWVVKLTVTNGSSSATQTVTVVSKH